MLFELTPEEREVQKTVSRFVSKDLFPNRTSINSRGALTDDLKKRFFGIGLLSSVFPEEYGGTNGSFTSLVIGILELSYASMVPCWMLLENYLLAYPIYTYGSDFLKERYLPNLISMIKTGALAFTETETGSDPSQLRTTAKKTKDGWLINGAKRFITYSGICDQMILFAKTADQVTAFLVESGSAGYSIGKRESYVHEKNMDNGEVYFDDVFVGDDRVIGDVGQGFNILLETEAMGKILFSAFYVGMAKRAIDLSVEYANNRKHRGIPIGKKFQMIQYKLSCMASEYESMRSYLIYVSAKCDKNNNINYEAALLKVIVGDRIKKLLSYAMEIHGAYGLSEEFEIEALYRTAISAQSIMGCSDIQRVIVAREMLG